MYDFFPLMRIVGAVTRSEKVFLSLYISSTDMLPMMALWWPSKVACNTKILFKNYRKIFLKPVTGECFLNFFKS